MTNVGGLFENIAGIRGRLFTPHGIIGAHTITQLVGGPTLPRSVSIAPQFSMACFSRISSAAIEHQSGRHHIVNRESSSVHRILRLSNCSRLDSAPFSGK